MKNSFCSILFVWSLTFDISCHIIMSCRDLSLRLSLFIHIHLYTFVIKIYFCSDEYLLKLAIKIMEFYIYRILILNLQTRKKIFTAMWEVYSIKVSKIIFNYSQIIDHRWEESIHLNPKEESQCQFEYENQV
jgi:hypothetical protein